jgi:hypothetical protein
MSTTEQRSLLAQLEDLCHHPPQDSDLRKELYNAVRGASIALETPIDTVRRLSFAVHMLVLLVWLSER